MNMENGIRVKINWKKISSVQHFDDLREDYKQFVLNNKDTIFITSREKTRKKNSPLISLLYEDGTNASAWLFTEEYLIPVKE